MPNDPTPALDARAEIAVEPCPFCGFQPRHNGVVAWCWGADGKEAHGLVQLTVTDWNRRAASRALAPAPTCTGCKDKDGNMLFLGDRVRYRCEGPHTKKEYWNPEYEIVWKPPCFTLKHIGGGKSGGDLGFVLRYGGPNGDLELIERGPFFAAPSQSEAERREAYRQIAKEAVRAALASNVWGELSEEQAAEIAADAIAARGAPAAPTGAVEPVAWLCNGKGDGWEERDKIIRDPELAAHRAKSPFWTVTPLIPASAPTGHGAVVAWRISWPNDNQGAVNAYGYCDHAELVEARRKQGALVEPLTLATPPASAGEPTEATCFSCGGSSAYDDTCPYCDGSGFYPPRPYITKSQSPRSHVGYSIANKCWWVRFYGYASEAEAKALEKRLCAALATPAATDAEIEAAWEAVGPKFREQFAVGGKELLNVILLAAAQVRAGRAEP